MRFEARHRSLTAPKC